MSIRRGLLLVLAAAACSDSGGKSADGGPSGGDDGSPGDGGGDGCQPSPSEITCEGLDGAWVFENVSRTAGTISLEGDLAISAGGRMMTAWGEPLAEATFDQDIYSSSWAGCAWQDAAPLTDDSEVQNTYPSLAVEGDTFHLVWSGYPEGLNDVYYSANSGAGWSERVNLTADYESSMMRHAYSPAISLGPGGAIAIAYLSAPADPEGGFDGPAEVRVAELEADTLVGPPVTVIPAGADGCFNPRAVHDGDGQLHVLAECGPVFDQDIVWATDDGPGPWTSEPLPGTAGHDDLSVTVASAGGAVHAAWSADLPCGDGTCRTLQYSHLDGATWSDPATASQGGAPADLAPSLAIAADGTVYIAFWRDNADAKADVYLTRATDGETFAAPCNLTRTDADNEWMPSALQLDPRTGALHLLYEAFVPDSDPLDTEIVHAWLL